MGVPAGPSGVRLGEARAEVPSALGVLAGCPADPCALSQVVFSNETAEWGRGQQLPCELTESSPERGGAGQLWVPSLTHRVSSALCRRRSP